MPLYEYSAPGIKIELRRPVEDRNKDVIMDGMTLKRLKDIPDSLIVFGSRPSEAESFDHQILKAYHRKEEREGSRFRSSYSKKTLARVYEHARKLS